MARTKSMTSIDNDIKKIEDELSKVRNRQEELEAQLLELKKAKQELETQQIMKAFKKSGKSLRELMVFLEG